MHIQTSVMPAACFSRIFLLLSHSELSQSLSAVVQPANASSWCAGTGIVAAAAPGAAWMKEELGESAVIRCGSCISKDASCIDKGWTIMEDVGMRSSTELPSLDGRKAQLLYAIFQLSSLINISRFSRLSPS
jgi:hypothetical protein